MIGFQCPQAKGQSIVKRVGGQHGHIVEMTDGAAYRIEAPLTNLKQTGQVHVDGLKKKQSELVDIVMVGVK